MSAAHRAIIKLYWQTYMMPSPPFTKTSLGRIRCNCAPHSRPAAIAVTPRSAEVIGSHRVPGQTVIRVVVTAIIRSDVQSGGRLGVVESQRDPASVGQANEQRRAAYERGDGNLPCAYRLHGRSQKMNFNATTGRRFALDQGNQQIEFASPSNSPDQFGSNNANLEDSAPA